MLDVVTFRTTVVVALIGLGLMLWLIGSYIEKILTHVRQLDERHEMHLAAQGLDSKTLEKHAQIQWERAVDRSLDDLSSTGRK